MKLIDMVRNGHIDADIFDAAEELPIHSCEVILYIVYENFISAHSVEYSAKHNRFNASDDDKNLLHAFPKPRDHQEYYWMYAD